jgi:hypothetical protein
MAPQHAGDDARLRPEPAQIRIVLKAPAQAPSAAARGPRGLWANWRAV